MAQMQHFPGAGQHVQGVAEVAGGGMPASPDPLSPEVEEVVHAALDDERLMTPRPVDELEADVLGGEVEGHILDVEGKAQEYYV